MTIEPAIIKPQFPALSKAGRWFGVLSVPWFFGMVFALDALGLVGRDVPQAQRWLGVLVAAAPVLTLIFHPWVGHVPGLRWIHDRIQPRLTIREHGLDLQLPGIGARFYGWDEVTGLRTRHGRGADLLGQEGAALATIPQTMVLGGQGWSRRQTIAMLVVRARPDRYRLSGATWAGVPNEFALRTSIELPTAADPWTTRRRLTSVVIVVVFVAVSSFLVFRYLTT